MPTYCDRGPAGFGFLGFFMHAASNVAVVKGPKIGWSALSQSCCTDPYSTRSAKDCPIASGTPTGQPFVERTVPSFSSGIIMIRVAAQR